MVVWCSREHDMRVTEVQRSNSFHLFHFILAEVDTQRVHNGLKVLNLAAADDWEDVGSLKSVSIRGYLKVALFTPNHSKGP